MKRLILFFLLGINLDVLWAQHNDMLINKSIQVKGDERWNLDKFVWSHTHQLSSKPGKPILDFNAIDNWMSFPVGKNVTISRNGQYIIYGISTNRLGEVDSVVLQSTVSEWRQAIVGSNAGFFSADSKLYFFQDKEELCFMTLGSDQNRKVKDVLSFNVPLNGNLSGKNEWIAYQLKNKDVVLQNLLTGKEKRFEGVINYGFDRTGKWLTYQLGNDKELVVYNLSFGSEFTFSSVNGYSFDGNGSVLLLKTSSSSVNRSGLQYVDLSDGKAISIWETSDNDNTISDLQLDGAGKQVVFVVQDSSRKNSIWYWREGMEKAVMKLKDNSVGIAVGLLIQGKASFTDNNHYIQFYLAPQIKEEKGIDTDAVQVDVWNYKDTILQSTQPYLLKEQAKFTAVLDLANGMVIQLEKENEKLIIRGISGDVAIVQTKSDNDRFWEKENGNNRTFVVFFNDGSRKPLTEKVGVPSVRFSPDGNYFIFFNGDKIGNYFSYNLRNGKLVNISARVPSGQFGIRSEDPSLTYITVDQMIGWLGEKGLLVADNYDIWQLDLDGKKPPVNFTKGYGRQHKTIFRISGEAGMGVYSNKDTLLLKAFNQRTKFNGYYRMVLGVPGNPEKLYMGPCFMENLNGISGSGSGMFPMKAADASIWIVQRQTATEAPNYFVTRDFKDYKPLTHLQPQKNYNWLTTELHSYRHLDGTLGKGVLYRPENFDPTKKYPVVISFYAALSDQLYQFLPPNYISSPVIFARPAWMVSHGYLVFVPDIRFIPGNWGLSTMNSIEGAARYLKTLSYVDGERMGAAGHSNSGRFGYYLFTHSKSFAAMSMGGGAPNLLSSALLLQSRGKEESNLEWHECSAYGSGGLGNLWQNKDLWMDHTAVLHIDKAISPLLIFQNKKDNALLSSVQMYIALRRLAKPAWWLQYDDEGHTISKVKDLRDFTIRYTQFFDHFLKSAPAPRWMTEGIPYRLKGIESRYELDWEGSCGKKCMVCKKSSREFKQ
ncbi:S9 family peptidase [Niastella caeni]|nr:prolyl oligopeptidase family serine peptidase [Niastella caeni]